MFIPPFFRPGEIAWISVRQPRIKPETATGDTKMRPAMLVGEPSPGKWMVVGLTSLAKYADDRPRTPVPVDLWAPVATGRPNIRQNVYFWGPTAPVVGVDDIIEHITDAGPELRAAIVRSVDNVPKTLRNDLLRLRPDELQTAIEAGDIPKTTKPSEWPLIPGANKPTAEASEVAEVAPPTPEPEPDSPAMTDATNAKDDTNDPEPMGPLTDEVVAALTALARVAGDEDPFFRSTFNGDVVRLLLAEIQDARERSLADRQSLASARSALVAARSEIRRLARGEPNWGGPETAAIAAIDETLRVA